MAVGSPVRKARGRGRLRRLQRARKAREGVGNVRIRRAARSWWDG